MDDVDRVRERASVFRHEPPEFGIEEPLWVAEDDETDCMGVGRVRAEAEGNLLAVVLAHERDPEVGYVKLPGEVVERSWQEESGLLSALRDRLLRGRF